MFIHLLFVAIFLKSTGKTIGGSSESENTKPGGKTQMNIAIISANTNTSEIESVMAEALELSRSLTESLVNATLFVLENYTTSLEFSLVKFCEKVREGNITSVIISEPLLQQETGFNFIPWIASQLGIIVALMRGIRSFPTMQDHEFNLVFSMKPIIYEQSQALAELALTYNWFDVTILFAKEKSLDIHMKELVRRIQTTKPLLLVRTVEISNSFDIRDKLLKVRASKTTLVVLYCSSSSARKILETAAALKLFNGNQAWVVTDCLTEDPSLLPWLPIGVLGMRIRSSQESSSLTQDLVHDSIVVSAHAQSLDLKNNGKMSSVKKSCDNMTTGKPTDEFLRKTLSSIKMTGKTGHIQFDKNGNRIKPEYDILNLHSSSMGKKEWKRISYWNTNENRLIPNGVSMKWLGGKIIHPTNSLNMKEVRVITALTEPFAFYGSRDEDVKDGKVVCALGFPCKTLKSLGNGTSSFQTKCCKGLAMDLLRMLESDLGFKADLHVVKDGKYGGFNRQTRSWNGLIGELMRGEADMAVADLTITDSRSQVVDFTQPYLHVGLGILVSVEKDRQAWLLRFLDPFSIEMWIVTIATINIVFVLLWFLDKNSPGGHYRKGGNYKEKKKFHLIASLWFTWGSVFRTDECESRPRSYSSRALAVVFAFGMLVITNTYTANLAAVLVSENEANSISGIQDPKLQNPTNGFTIGTVKETSMEKVFKESTDPVYSQIWKKMKLNQVNTFAEGVQKVYNGELSAFIGDEPTLLYHISKQKTCKLKLVGKPFFQSGFGIALTKNSSFTNKLSDILILYQKLDTYRKLTQRWLSGTCNNNAKPGSNFKEMTIDDLGGAYVIVLIGVFTSVVVLAFEFYVDKFGFPFSHIWTNKPHRHFPSTRELFKKGIIRNKRSQWFSTAPLELSISHRRFIESMHKSSLNYGASYEEKVEPGPNEDIIFKTDYSASTYTEYNSSASLSCPASPVSITFGTSLRDCKMNRTL